MLEGGSITTRDKYIRLTNISQDYVSTSPGYKRSFLHDIQSSYTHKKPRFSFEKTLDIHLKYVILSFILEKVIL